MNAIVAVLSVLIVGGAAAYGVYAVMGPWTWLVACVVAFFALMAGMAKLNAV
jgi:hypothetical protein